MAIEARELQQRIDSFPRWSHRFEFEGGVATPTVDPAQPARDEQLRRHFFRALLQACDGSLAGRRVLDLGCGAGFWSLQAIEAGAEFLLGLDDRAMHVEQAGLVFEAKGVDPARYRFEEADVFQRRPQERFDVVLCLGLMGHLSRPFELFELFDAVGAQLVVIDTGISFAPGSSFELRAPEGQPGDPREAAEPGLVFVPNRGAVTEFASHFGYETVPLAHDMTDSTDLPDYRSGRRLAFICGRGVSLDALARERKPRATPWWRVLANPYRLGWQRPAR